MSKHRPRIPMGSLSDMASTVRNKKTASKTNPLGSTQLQKNQKLAKDTSSDDDSSTSSSDDSDRSGSDSENDLEAAKSKYAAKQATKRKVTEPKANATKSEPTKTIPNAGASSSSKVSTKAAASKVPDDSDSDSDSQSSDSSDSPAKNGAAVKGGNKDEEEAESASDSESDDEDPSAQRTAEAESSSDEASDSSSDDDSEEAHGMEIDSDEVAISRVNGNDASEVSRPGWLNSSEFVIRKASSDNPAKEVAEFFSKTNLEGKQVWYFTAPASLPITVLKDMEIDLSKATPGEALLNHKGDDYGLDLESHATSTQIQLLIPSQGGDNYTSLNRGIDSTVHLRRIAKFGPGGTVSATATEDYAPIPKAIREQPQGLRPRFTPIGVPSSVPQVQPSESRPVPTARADSSSESDSESESASDEDSAVLPTPTNAKKSKKPAAVNGKLKRKQPEGEVKSTPIQEPRSQEKSAKRPKTTKPAPSKVSSSNNKETPVSTQRPNGTPSNKKEKSKYSIQPTKQTPVPVPKVFSMNR
ncbi:DNA-directed RNA polymerase I subunit RPA34.5-domain-containing protein [Daldinia loculata]|uniref:DNA-directed RNA polymerase I subunit RPA34.5-domain-containing protein n=1 Tax=Daldinia loculata TaxID=103429 RepID=UPI0020C3C08C|nr:DNA-directed RNA polymerase I subunit RPA34.5-domain-containing protein [Daldinia loculata]KAI1645166.1 DNA-directed RNA polymerase I subunit RPA34.5-domain-containing protein [Daldinia loculata]